MNIYKISQEQSNDYDTFDSAIVAANSEDEARLIVPDFQDEDNNKDGDYVWNYKFSSWCKSPDYVKVEYIGIAKEGTEKGIILSSFNAG